MGCGCAGYLLFVGVVVGGLWKPYEKTPPRTDAPLPTAPARQASQAPPASSADDPAGSRDPAPGDGRAGRATPTESPHAPQRRSDG